MSDLTHEQILAMPASAEMDELIQRTFFGGSSVRRPWSIDIASAMSQLLPEIMGAIGATLTILPGGAAELDFTLPIGSKRAPTMPRFIRAKANSVSLAICRAALLTELKD